MNNIQNHTLDLEENISLNMQDTAITASLELPLGRPMAYLRLPTEIREMIWSLLLPSNKTFRFVQHKQSETLPTSDAAAPSRAEKQTPSTSVLPDLRTINIEELISELRGLKSISIPFYS